MGAKSMIEVTMCSRSLSCCTHSMNGVPSFRSTSTIVRSTSNGSRPTLIVRLAWLSRSMSSTLFPAAAMAAPRLCVVVVLATPPFWFAIAITFTMFTPLFTYVIYLRYILYFKYIIYSCYIK